MRRFAKFSATNRTVLHLEQLESRVLLTALGFAQQDVESFDALDSQPSHSGDDRPSAFVDSGVRPGSGANSSSLGNDGSSRDFSSHNGPRHGNDIQGGNRLPQQAGNERDSWNRQDDRPLDRDGGVNRQSTQPDNLRNIVTVLTGAEAFTANVRQIEPTRGGSDRAAPLPTRSIGEIVANRSVLNPGLSLPDSVERFANRPPLTIVILGSGLTESGTQAQSGPSQAAPSAVNTRLAVTEQSAGTPDSQRQFSNTAVTPWQDDELVSSLAREQASTMSDDNRYGGVIDFDNQPSLQDTLPLFERERRPTEYNDALNSDDEESKNLTDGEESFNDLSSGLVDEPNEVDPENESRVSNAPSTPHRGKTSALAEMAANDLLFAELADIEDFGGLIEFVSDVVVGEATETNTPFPVNDVPKAALQVDTIIGQAPLLKLDELPIGENVSAKTASDVHPAAATSAALLLMPWRIRRIREQE